MSEVDFSLDGRAALITGGSKGIGRSIAIAFAEHGANVAIVARGRDALDATCRDIEAAGRRCLALGANMAREEDWQRIVDDDRIRIRRCPHPGYGAATAEDLAPIIESTSEGWDRVMRVNLKGAFTVSKLCHPHMKNRGGGSVIHITSNESVRPSFGLDTYSISKGAMVTMT